MLKLKIETMWKKRQEIAEERLKICQECEHYRPATTQCVKCACFMKAKTMWPTAKCPINRWGPYEDNNNG